jgi:hypothetical protein
LLDSTTTPWTGWKTTAAITSAPTLNSVQYANGGANLYFAPPSGLRSFQTIRGYEWQLSIDAGVSVWSDNSTSQTTSPINVYCPFGSTCSYRLRALLDSTTTPWTAWVTAA